MPSEDEFDSRFEDIVSSLGGLVGENEVNARKFLGNEQYDKIMGLIDLNNALLLQKEASQIQYLKMLSGLYASISCFVVFAMPILLSWSIYYWVK